MPNVDISRGLQCNFVMNKNIYGKQSIRKEPIIYCQMPLIRYQKKHNQLTLLAKKQTHNNL
jgi:hypothetical protein